MRIAHRHQRESDRHAACAPAPRPRAAPAARRGSASTAMRAARMERAAGRQIAQQRRQAGNALHHPLALQRRQAGDQHLRVGMPRRGDDLARSARSRPGGRHTSRRADRRTAPSAPCRGRPAPPPRRVPAARGASVAITWRCTTTSSALVGSSAMITFGLQADGDGDADALLHAAGEFVRIHLRHLGRQADLAEQIAHARGRRRAATVPCHDRPARRRSARGCAAPG